MSTSKWHRACPGLYVDPTETWVVNNEGPNFYSIRACLGYGPMPDGVRMFPDYGGIWHGTYRTVAEAKHAVEQMTANGETPALDGWDEARRDMNNNRKGNQ